ncbi:MAG: 23S rRNA (uridine(2552)-2'-O)-methyltransferase [gamma proteobacterium endosymbiont of Trioza apicalis]
MFFKKTYLNSNKWMKNHFKDKYVKKAKKNKLYSRAWFKLSEIQKRDKILNLGMSIIDLGSSPGGWLQYIKKTIGENGLIIACDILPINSIKNVFFIKEDVCNNIILKKILKYVEKNKVDVVLSDISPNISGISEIDIPKFIYIIKNILNICKIFLKKNGNFVIKIFQGEGLNFYIKKIKFMFKKIKIRKPKASRVNSKEFYIIAKGYKK